jgi:hypothetical protein
MTGIDRIPLELISSAIEDNAYLNLHRISGKGIRKHSHHLLFCHIDFPMQSSTKLLCSLGAGIGQYAPNQRDLHFTRWNRKVKGKSVPQREPPRRDF